MPEGRGARLPGDGRALDGVVWTLDISTSSEAPSEAPVPLAPSRALSRLRRRATA